jgi:ArsR family transcriptional regulator, arsenate/arsenite/antimonite-responsive transcriptional repressor
MRVQTSNRTVLLAKALADANRLRIVLALRAGELCVCELCDVLEVSQSTLSTHLQMIRKAGIAASRKAGKWMYYKLTPDGKAAAEFYGSVCGAALESEALFQADAARLEARLKLRADGVCCVGFCDCKDGGGA